MHKPKVHKVLNFENNYGNSTLLSSTDKSINKAINEFENNLDIITSGPVPPNPSELVLSKRVNDLINFQEKNMITFF